jgi:aquaporin Z
MLATRIHWPEYLMEMCHLGAFLVCALAVATIMEHPASPVRHTIDVAWIRRAITGLAMGLTAVAVVYSPWGRRSGAHFNPSVTLTFLRLGKIAPIDAFFYVVAQFAGATAAVALVASVVRSVVGNPAVNYVATVPGFRGSLGAFAGEVAISFGMMTMILIVSNTPRIAHLTGVLAGAMVALYITVEAPLSGMSMNPARSFGPALAAGTLNTMWIYGTAPLLGMLLAAEFHVRRRGHGAIRCAKIHHPSAGPCHFRCTFHRRPS